MFFQVIWTEESESANADAMRRRGESFGSTRRRWLVVSTFVDRVAMESTETAP